MRLNSRKASINSGPYIAGSSSARAWPSPCSPEMEPPNFTTSSVAAKRNFRQCAVPCGVRRLKVMRAWMQPSPKCPYSEVR